MPELLNDDQVATALEGLSEWSRDGDSLVRDVDVAADDREALESSVMARANEMDHHPDVEQTGDGLRFRLSTHSAGGITALDVELAAAIDQIVSGSGGDPA